MSAAYQRLAAEHAASPAFSPLVPRSALSPLALVLLVAAFILTFAFTTVGTTSPPRRRRAGAKAAPPPAQSTLGQELLLGSTASVAGGIGLVLAFCAIGANV